MKLNMVVAVLFIVSISVGWTIRQRDYPRPEANLTTAGTINSLSPHSDNENEQRSAAPDFALLDLDGKTVRLDDFRGKIVVLKFWATWCPSCRNAMSEVEALHQQYRSAGLVVLAVDFQEDTAEVRAFFRDHQLSFAGLLDPKGEVFELYGTWSLPTTFVIDKRGKVVEKIIGWRDWQSAQSKALLARLLGEPA